MYLPHPLSVTLCQIIVDRYYMYAFSRQGIQISRKGGGQSLSFTGTHLGNTSLVQNDTADNLDAEMFHPQHTHGRLPHDSIRLGQNVVKSRLAL